MNGRIGVTENGFVFLSRQRAINEVNFWQPEAGARSRKNSFHLAVRGLEIVATAVGERSGASQTGISTGVHRRERSARSHALNLGDEKTSQFHDRGTRTFPATP